MATIVCQGLQSCLESPHLVEPRTLRLKLSASIPYHFSPTPLDFGIKSFFSNSNQTKDLADEEDDENDHFEEISSINKPASKNPNLGGGWSFLQAVSNDLHQTPPEAKKDTIYTPPQASTKLTEKSLKLCTEDLGCETGTIITENNVFERKPREQQQQQKLRQNSGGNKKGNVAQSFPPPLTTISGSGSLQVRPQREDGRLIIKAVKAPVSHSSCFQSERSNGRLRLSVLTNFVGPDFDNEVCEDEAYESDINEDEEEEEQIEDLVEKIDGEEEGEEGEVMSLIDEGDEEMDGNRMNVGGEEGMMKFESRPSRCKEGGEGEKKGGLLNWEPFWVAT